MEHEAARTSDYTVVFTWKVLILLQKNCDTDDPESVKDSLYFDNVGCLICLSPHHLGINASFLRKRVPPMVVMQTSYNTPSIATTLVSPDSSPDMFRGKATRKVRSLSFSRFVRFSNSGISFLKNLWCES